MSKARYSVPAQPVTTMSLNRLSRARPSRTQLPVILIVCDGRNTEPSYFRQFRLASAKVVPVGSGNNTMRTVQEAIRLRNADTYDQAWCVFDRDSFPAANFDNAVKMALANDLQVAYSNQAFEYWLLLHFEDHQGGSLPRTDYDARLNQHINTLGASYDGTGSKLISSELFRLLEAPDPAVRGRTRRKIAIGRARKLAEAKQHLPPSQQESTTLVYKLVMMLQRHM
jgi:hypothetical protein